MISRIGPSLRLLLLFGLVSFATVTIGAFVCASNGVPASLWLRNLAAWAAGGLAATAIAGAWRPGFLPVALWAAPIGLAATFFSAGQLGVHRWLDLGPLHMNAAMLLLPSAVVAFAALMGERRWPWLAILCSLGFLAAQPDASQATTLGAVAALGIALAVPRPIVRGALFLVVGVLTAMAWFQPDPLQPVAEVEGVFGLAFSLSPVVGGLAAVFLAATTAAPALVAWSGPSAGRHAGSSLSLCLVFWAAAPLVGAFPVPLVGIGLSPIIGSWLGVGLLAGLLGEEARAVR